jgi:hypothetical protein
MTAIHADKIYCYTVTLISVGRTVYADHAALTLHATRAHLAALLAQCLAASGTLEYYVIETGEMGTKLYHNEFNIS